MSSAFPGEIYGETGEAEGWGQRFRSMLSVVDVCEGDTHEAFRLNVP